MTDDLTPDLNDSSEINTERRNRELDLELLKSGDEIAGMTLRAISAGDLALLIEMGVGLVVGRTDSIAFDVGAILYSQSHGKNEIRRLATRRQDFRAAVYDFLDSYCPSVFTEATPRIISLVEKVNLSRTAVKGEAGQAGTTDPKAGGQAG